MIIHQVCIRARARTRTHTPKSKGDPPIRQPLRLGPSAQGWWGGGEEGVVGGGVRTPAAHEGDGFPGALGALLRGRIALDAVALERSPVPQDAAQRHPPRLTDVARARSGGLGNWNFALAHILFSDLVSVSPPPSPPDLPKPRSLPLPV